MVPSLWREKLREDRTGYPEEDGQSCSAGQGAIQEASETKAHG